jgi:hypothetical protein
VTIEDWKIQRDRTRCVEPGCTLPTAREWFAVLELPQCVRRDLCATCFHKLENGAGEPPIFWRAQRRSDGRKSAALDLVTLRHLFDRLGGVEDENARGLRYFIALLLLRKRVLRVVEPRNAAEEAADLVVVDAKVEGMEPQALVAPSLDLERLAALKDELLAAVGELEVDDAAAAGSAG